MANIDFSTIEMNRGNQSIFVAADVKHSQIVNKIYAWQHCAQFEKFPNELLVMSVNQRLRGV